MTGSSSKCSSPAKFLHPNVPDVMLSEFDANDFVVELWVLEGPRKTAYVD